MFDMSEPPPPRRGTRERRKKEPLDAQAKYTVGSAHNCHVCGAGPSDTFPLSVDQRPGHVGKTICKSCKDEAAAVALSPARGAAEAHPWGTLPDTSPGSLYGPAGIGVGIGTEGTPEWGSPPRPPGGAGRKPAIGKRQGGETKSKGKKAKKAKAGGAGAGGAGADELPDCDCGSEDCGVCFPPLGGFDFKFDRGGGGGNPGGGGGGASSSSASTLRAGHRRWTYR